MRCFLDTSALVKRYVEEPGSDVVDGVFARAHAGDAVIVVSYWNIGEAAVVFDKYGRMLGLDAVGVFRTMLRELRMLSRARGLMLVRVSSRVLRMAVKRVFRYHIYVADAVQLASAERAGAERFLTGDRKLAGLAEKEGFQVMRLFG